MSFNMNYYHSRFVVVFFNHPMKSKMVPLFAFNKYLLKVNKNISYFSYSGSTGL